MFALLLNPIVWRGGLVLAALLAVIGALWLVEKRAADRALVAVERANTEAARKADEGERNVLTCPPELWSRELRKCATKLH
jgi:predicted outer membrane lipoprotein